MIVRGFAISSAVEGIPVTPAIATALAEQMLQLEGPQMWGPYLTDESSPNAQEWGLRAHVDIVWSSEIGAVDPDLTLAVVQLVSALPAGTPAEDIAYHTVDALGRPLCLISYVAAGSDWVSAMSHELCEARVNARVNMQSPPAPDGTTWDLEVCDPVQGTDYAINGVMVANFVGPSFFALPGATGPLDANRATQQAFHELPGGYHDGSVGQVFGAYVSAAKEAEVTRNGVRGKTQRSR